MVNLGEHVTKNQLLAIINDPFGENETKIKSPYDGIVIGQTTIPLVYEGDALFHIAYFGETEKVAENVEAFVEYIMPDNN